MKNGFGFALWNMIRASRHWAEQGARVRAMPAWAMMLVFFSALAMCSVSSAPVCQASPAMSSEAAARDFVIRLKDGQAKFHQGEIITVELGYGADPEAPVKRFPNHPEQPGLAVDRFVLSPHAGIVDPLRDFLSTVGGWSGSPPRKVPFVEAEGSWATVDINEWFRFDKPGKYTLSVLAHDVRTGYEAFGIRQASASTFQSNRLEFEIVPAEEGWQAATLQKALALLDSEPNDGPNQGCRILRFLATPQAVDKMVEFYAGETCGTQEFRDGLFAYADRAYTVRKMESGILEPSIGVSADYLDTLARLSACLERPDSLPGEDEQFLGSSEWPGLVIGSADIWELTEEKQNHYVQELLGALDTKLDRPRALCLKAIFDSPYTGRPTLLQSMDASLLAKLRKEIAASFTELPVSDQFTLLYYRWENIASPAMIPVLKRLYANPPSWFNDQSLAFVLNDLYRIDPGEGRALILAEMKRARPRLDLRFVTLLRDKELPELDDPLVENLEAGNGDEDTILQLIGRYATPAIFPRVMAVEESRVVHLSCDAQSAFLSYVVKSDAARGVAMLEESMAAHNNCSVQALADVASRQFTPEVQRLAEALLGDSDAQVAAAAATILGHDGSPEAEPLLWDRLEKWHALWAGRASELPDGLGGESRNGLETMLEMSLIEALGTGRNWFAGPGEVSRLSRLCVSTGGCDRVNAIGASVEEAAHLINVYGFAPDYRASVAQYEADSVEALKQKLAQFPEGSTFTWSFAGDEKEGASILAALRDFLKSHSMTIR